MNSISGLLRNNDDGFNRFRGFPERDFPSWIIPMPPNLSGSSGFGLLNTAASIINVTNTAVEVVRLAKRVFEGVIGFFQNDNARAANHAQDGPRPTNGGQPPEVDDDFMHRVREIQHWQRSNRIPDWLADIEPFNRYICPITNHPIRRVLVAENDGRKIYYEKAAIYDLQPNDMLPGWPEGVVVRANHVRVDRQAQREIDGALEQCALELAVFMGD